MNNKELLYKKLNCLRLEVHGSIVDDIKSTVDALFQEQNLQQTVCYTMLPLAELGDFVDWITEVRFKMYAEGWCEAGGSNGWHCTTDELLQMFRDRGNIV